MLCRVQLGLQLDSKRDPQALTRLLASIRQHFRVTAKSTLTPSLRLEQNRDAVREIARSLPTASGFSVGGRSVLRTGAEMLSADAETLRRARFVHFNHDLLEHLNLEAGLALVERWLMTDEGPRKGIHGSLHGQGFAVKGMDGAVAAFSIRDFQNYPEKKMRAWLRVEMPAASTDHETARAVLVRLERRTGLPWRRAKINFAAEVESMARDRTARLTEQRHYLTASVYRIASRLRRLRLRWRDLPRLDTKSGGLRQRMNQIIGQGAGRVNFGSIVKEFVKAALPGFEHRKSAREAEFVAPIGCDADVTITFERVHYSGIGKAFMLVFGLRMRSGAAGGAQFTFRLGQFLDHYELVWTYATTEDLRAALAEAKGLIDRILPQWRAACAAMLDAGETGVLDIGPSRAPLTFHEAVLLAARDLGAYSNRFTTLHGASLRVPTDLRLALAPVAFDLSGMLQPGQQWSIRLTDRVSGRGIWISIPQCGEISYSLMEGIQLEGARSPEGKAGRPTRVEAPRDLDEPIMLDPVAQMPDPLHLEQAMREHLSTLADSPEICGFAAVQGGEVFRQQHPDCVSEIQLVVDLLQDGTSDGRWMVTYRVPERPGQSFSLSCTARRPLAVWSPPGISDEAGAESAGP